MVADDHNDSLLKVLIDPSKFVNEDKYIFVAETTLIMEIWYHKETCCY